MIYIENRKRKLENIQKEYPNAEILDVTSKSPYHSARILSPFYPHKNIPIPFTVGITASCVESIWQGLKVFEHYDVDLNCFNNDTMIGIKRSVRKYGIPLGHRKGVYGDVILNYFDARMQIYIPTYKWVLDNIDSVRKTINRIKVLSESKDIVLLDYNTNTEFRNTSSPISHAGLIKLYIEDKYPSLNNQYEAMTASEIKEHNDIKKKERAIKRKKQNK
ncbi:MAG: hypothetical protein SNI70_09505 [Rikenellaceae bacterium]